MRFVTFETRERIVRLGFLTSQGRIVDLEAAFAGKLSSEMPRERACELAAALTPPEMVAFLDGGECCMDAARQTVSFVEGAIAAGKMPLGPSGEKILFDPAEVSMKAPLPRPRKIICAGKNFGDHLKEMASRGGNMPTNPVAFAKVPSVVIGPEDRVPYPGETAMLDYEVEMAIVIGKRCREVSREKAYDHVFGFTIFNDISARDLGNIENEQGVFLLCKNLPGFAPMGPYLITRDEIEDPQALHLQCRVNGEIRQDSSLTLMVFKIDEIIAYWSQIGLEPGDVLATGTPSGVAAGRKVGESPWWLKPGDIVEAGIEQLGTLRTYIG
jgi:acylpyruvate hydrolase